MADETFGQRVKRLRLAAGLSQSGLARAVGIPVDTVQNWETGRRAGPRLETAVTVAAALGVTLDELAGPPPKKKPRKKRKSQE
jgi:transcriptional regulator with XRE-family HTH domain